MSRKSQTKLVLGGLGCLMISGLGCQTWVGGMTLPSPDYLRDKPDYIQPAPVYKHSRELASMQRAMAESNPNADSYATRPAQQLPPAAVPAPAPAAPANPNPMPPTPIPPGGN
jgi:hypothetical protein